MKRQLRKITALLLVLSLLLGLAVTASADGGGAERPREAESENADISAFHTDTDAEGGTAAGADSGGSEDAGVAYCFRLNGLSYGYDAQSGAFSAWDNEKHESVALPEAVSCAIVGDVLTVTLDSASLTSLWFDYKGTDTDEDGTTHSWQHLPSERLTLVLTGESTISDSIGFGDGIHVTVQGEGSLAVGGNGLSFETALTVTGGTLKVPGLWVYGTYTQTGGAVIADTADSDSHMAFAVIGAFEDFPAASAVISGGTLELIGEVEIGGSMTIRDTGAVTVQETQADAEFGSRAVGLFGSLAVEGGSLTVENTGNAGEVTLALYVEGGTYTQTGGTVALTSTRNIALEIDEVEDHVSAVTISGGSLTATGGTHGCRLYSGALTQTGGEARFTGGRYGLYVTGGSGELGGGTLALSGASAAVLVEKSADAQAPFRLGDGMQAVSDGTQLTLQTLAWLDTDDGQTWERMTYFQGNEPNGEKSNLATDVTISPVEGSGGDDVPGDYLAGFSVNDQWYEVHRGEDTSTVIGYWSDGDSFVEGLPAGVSYDYDRNALTLTNAHLTQLGAHYRWFDTSDGTAGTDLPNADLTLELVGESTIIGAADNVVSFYSDVAVTVTGSGTLTVGWADGYTDTTDKSPFRWDDASLTVESGTLVVNGAVWGGGSYTQSGGSVTVTGSRFQENGWYGLVLTGEHSSTISGGSLTVTASYEAEGDWAHALDMGCGHTLNVTGGTVTVGGNDQALCINGIYMWRDEESGQDVTDPPAVMNVSGGTVAVNGTLSVNGTLNLSGTGAVNVTVDAGAEDDGTWASGIHADRHYYIDGQGNYDDKLSHPAAVNVTGGSLTVNITGAYNNAPALWSNGAVDISGGTVTLTKTGARDNGAIWLGDGGSYTQSGGSVTLSSPRPVALANVTISGGTLDMPGGWTDGSYTQTGGTVTVTGVQESEPMRNEDGSDQTGYYWQGLDFGSDSELSGGRLTVTINNSAARQDWADGICCNGAVTVSGDAEIHVTVERGVAMVVNSNGTYTQTGGTVTVTSRDTADPRAFTVNGIGMWYDEESGQNVTDPPAVATISGGSLIVNGTLSVSGTLNIAETGTVTVQAIGGGYAFADDAWQPAVLVSANTAGDPAALNLTGGSLTADALHANAPAICVGTGGSYTQNGGKATFTNAHEGGTAMDIASRAVVNGGTLTAAGDVTGILLYNNDTYAAATFTVNGGQVYATGGSRGLWAYGMIYEAISDMTWHNVTVELKGGSLVAAGRVGAAITTGYWIADPPAENADHITGALVPLLTVTGGEHTLDGEIYALSNTGDVAITGGTLHLFGGTTALFHSQTRKEQLPGEEQQVLVGGFALGDTMHAVSDTTGRELTLVADAPVDYYHSEAYEHYYHEDNTAEGSYATAVTISSAEGTRETSYAASMDIQSGSITAGAPVTVVYNVSGTGTVSFVLPAGMELVNGSISVNGVTYGSLRDIPVTGAATIAFRVIPTRADLYEIQAVFTLRDDEEPVERTETVSLTARDFQITLPTYTTSRTVRVTGLGTPGRTVRVTLTNPEKGLTVTGTATVTELGTFAMTIDLPVSGTEEIPFAVAVQQGKTEYTDLDLTLTWRPGIPQVKEIGITNTVHGSDQSTTVEEVTHIDFGEGYARPDRSFYTYWPNLRTFRFAVELTSNTNVIGVCVRAHYQDGSSEDIKLALEGDGVWRRSAILSRPPTGYQVMIVYQQSPDPADPAAPGEDDEVLVIRTEIIPITPIMDPSGTVYSGTEDAPGTPVSGATVTLYYSATKPDADTEGEVFDMSAFGQVNGMVTGPTGSYHWDVPSGWWRIVARYEDHTAASEWMEVLPVRTGVDLYLQIRDLTVTLTGSTVSAQLSDLLALGEGSQVLCAFYAADGRMVEVQSSAAVSGENITFTATADFAAAKVFVVSDTMEPLCAAVPVPPQQ